jgi:RNA polymerase sigma-70 factor (ECF subfamily)
MERMPEAHERTDGAEATYARNRSRIVAIAYRMLGSVADAEDVAQDAWLRWARVDTGTVRDPDAYLVRIATSLSLDRLRRRKARREAYQGEWLPEPVASDLDVEARVIRSDEVSYALLVVLETLSPLERAAYVLREGFDLPYDQIGEILDRSAPTVRQLAGRARRHLADHVRRRPTDRDQAAAATAQFHHAAVTGDIEGLMAVLAPDVALVADSGGRVRAPLLPVVGADKVARFLLAALARDGATVEVERYALNGAPGLIAWSRATGEAVTALVPEVSDGRIVALYLVANPDKLQRMSRPSGGAASSIQ